MSEQERKVLLRRVLKARILRLRSNLTEIAQILDLGDEHLDEQLAAYCHDIEKTVDAMARDRWSGVEHLRRIAEIEHIA